MSTKYSFKEHHNAEQQSVVNTQLTVKIEKVFEFKYKLTMILVEKLVEQQ